MDGPLVPMSDDATRQVQAVLERATERLLGLERALGEPFANRLRMESRAVTDTSAPLRVVVVGEFNSGKSTLINALLGANVLPTGIVPTTATLNEIRHGVDASVRVVDEDGTVTVMPLDETALKQFTARYGDHSHIASLRVASPTAPPDVVLFDTPGVNDINESRAELVYRLIPEADLVLYVFDVQQALKNTEAKFLRHRLLGDTLGKVVYILNHCDRVSDADALSTSQRLQNELRSLYCNVAAEMESRGAGVLAQRIMRASSQIRVIAISARETLRAGDTGHYPYSQGFLDVKGLIADCVSGSERQNLRLTKLAVVLSRSLSFVEDYVADTRATQSSDNGDTASLTDRLRCQIDELCKLAQRAEAVRGDLRTAITRALSSGALSAKATALEAFGTDGTDRAQEILQLELQRIVEAQLEVVNLALRSLSDDVASLEVTADNLTKRVARYASAQDDGKELEKLLSDPLNQMIAMIAAPLVIFQLGWIGIIGLIAAPFARGAWTQGRQQRAFAEYLQQALDDACREIATKFDNLITLTSAGVLDRACGAADRTQQSLRIILEHAGRLSDQQLSAIESEVRAVRSELRSGLSMWKDA